MLVAQCPECGTAFKVTLNELTLAEGRLQCGYCQFVFHAEDPVGEDTVETVAPESQDAAEVAEFEKAVDASDWDALQEDSVSLSNRASEHGALTPDTLEAVASSQVEPSAPTAKQNIQAAFSGDVASVQSEASALEAVQAEVGPGEADISVDTSPDHAGNGPTDEDKNINPLPTFTERILASASAWWLPIVLTTTLVLQIAWLIADRADAEPTLYGLWKISCELLSCEVGPYQNLHDLTLSAVAIESAGDNQAKMSAELLNRGQFQQVLPVLALALLDGRGRLLGQKQLRPGLDYVVLGDEKSERIFPSQKVVVGFWLQTPSGQSLASSYRLELVNPS